MFTPNDVNMTRVQAELDTLAEIGRTESGGISRYTFSPAHQQATAKAAAWMNAAGLEVHFDRWGNLYGRTPGMEEAASVLTGSHLDSVPNGGNFDGPLGVLSSLEAVRLIRERGLTLKRPLEVVSFIEEEGASFMGLLGSQLATGAKTDADVNDLSNRIGQRFDNLLSEIEFPNPVDETKDLRTGVAAYVELHIEQGRRLESAGVPIGIVTGIAAPSFVNIRLIGRSDHAGATAYVDRHDTLLAAAEIITAIRATGRNQFDGRGHMTVGHLEVQPNVANVVAGQTTFTVDFRAVDDSTADAMKDAVLEAVVIACTRHKLEYAIDSIQRVPAAPAAPAIQSAIRQGAEMAGVGQMDLVSWAAHDAMVMASVCDFGMIFVPCVDGRSHTPEEFTKPEDVAAGIAVMANTLVALAT